MNRVLVSTAPFCERNNLPLELLASAGLEVVFNPYGRRLAEEELADLIGDFDILVAGTEPVTKKVLDRANRLKFIARVGIGLDSVDLLAARDKGISLSYTPDAPAPAVAELTIGLMLSLLRNIHLSNADVHNGDWVRRAGRRLSEVTIGIIGVGRIGGRVLRRMSAFGSPRVLVNDIVRNDNIAPDLKLEWVGKEDLLRQSDVVSLHVPMTNATRDMIRREHLLSMKEDAFIINTARGGIVNESDLADVLAAGHLCGAAIDVFNDEPYVGPLARIPNCLLTAHLGSMSHDCRAKMEIGAAEEVVRFVRGEVLKTPVPNSEFDLRL